MMLQTVWMVAFLAATTILQHCGEVVEGTSFSREYVTRPDKRQRRSFVVPIVIVIPSRSRIAETVDENGSPSARMPQLLQSKATASIVPTAAMRDLLLVSLVALRMRRGGAQRVAPLAVRGGSNVSGSTTTAALMPLFLTPSGHEVTNRIPRGGEASHSASRLLSSVWLFSWLSSTSWWWPAGWHPWGYRITARGKTFLSLGDSVLCDVGRFLSTLKSSRKRHAVLKQTWLEIMRTSQTTQAMRIYRTLDALVEFCLSAGLID